MVTIIITPVSGVNHSSVSGTVQYAYMQNTVLMNTIINYIYYYFQLR